MKKIREPIKTYNTRANLTLQYAQNKIHHEVSKNDKVHNSFIKFVFETFMIKLL